NCGGEVVMLFLRVRDTSHRLEVSPRSRIDRVFRISNRRYRVLRLERRMNLARTQGRRELPRHWRRRIDYEGIAFSLPGQRVGIGVVGRVAGDYLQFIAAIGQQG